MIGRVILAVIVFMSCLLSGQLIAAAASPFGGVCDNNANPDSAVCSTQAETSANNNPNPLTGDNGTIGEITSIVAYAAGAAAILMIIISGLRFITANGDANKISSARSTLTNALIGIVVIVLGKVLIDFVLNKL